MGHLVNVALVISFSIAARLFVATFPYSGAATPPRFGDYEAQRHWMEMCSHLPTSSWYFYDVGYWGLDYPPLTAYHSAVCGYAGSLVHPDAFALDTSRGFEDALSKLLMRMSVIVSDLVLLIPVALLGGSLVQSVIIINAPPLLLIDHGHFQFNGVCVGFVLASVYCLTRGRDLLGSALFVCALSFKHMSLHLAAAFFFYLLGKHLDWKHPLKSLVSIGSIGVVVLGTFTLIWAPFLGPDQLFQVVHRLFPINRGLFEDKVANFWCSVSPILKLRQMFLPATLFRISLVVTVCSIIPTNIMVFKKPSNSQFVYALSCTSLGFFLFSFQVHEKTILMSLLPILLMWSKHPRFVLWYCIISSFSMHPLLTRDGLVIPYIILNSLLVFLDLRLHRISLFSIGAIFGMLTLHALFAFVNPPAALPHLFQLAITASSFAFFAGSMVYLHYNQYADFQRAD